MKPELKERDYMYRLMVGQLFYDGQQEVAMKLAESLGLKANPPPPSDKLFHIVSVGRPLVEEEPVAEASVLPMAAPSAGLDLEYDADIAPSTPEPSLYETIYLASHKARVRAAAFNQDGTLLATGSADSSIKVMDVERMLALDLGSGMGRQSGPDHERSYPVIRTLYDHMDEVNALAFHPRDQILASGGSDFTIKFFDFSKTAVKRACRTIAEVEPVLALSFHPTGDFILAGTQHPTLRLYDVVTGTAFVSPHPSDQHRGAVTDVSYADSGRVYVTSSGDGDVKVWDAVSGRCVQTFERAHDGAEVSSARLTRNSKYVLTAGKDSCVKLWELSARRCLIAYTGAGATGAQETRVQAAFNHTEDYVMLPDEKSGSLCSWDSRNADRKRLLALGHTAPVSRFAHSPTHPAFVTASDDFRARFWYKKTSGSS